MIHKIGKINYFFKGMPMQSDEAIVVDCIPENHLTALRKSDEQLFEFTHFSGLWLLKNHESAASVLYGTQFVLNE